MSLTSTVTIYHIPSDQIVNSLSVQQCCVNIIDTPGFGDTRGPEWDNKIADMLSATFESLAKIDYVLMVIKSSEIRLTESS